MCGLKPYSTAVASQTRVRVAFGSGVPSASTSTLPSSSTGWPSSLT